MARQSLQANQKVQKRMELIDRQTDRQKIRIIDWRIEEQLPIAAIYSTSPNPKRMAEKLPEMNKEVRRKLTHP